MSEQERCIFAVEQYAVTLFLIPWSVSKLEEHFIREGSLLVGPIMLYPK
jgi:hypothetical protein